MHDLEGSALKLVGSNLNSVRRGIYGQPAVGSASRTCDSRKSASAAARSDKDASTC